MIFTKLQLVLSLPCPAGEAYCWMSCLTLPDECSTPDLAQCTNSENEQCCTETDDAGNMTEGRLVLVYTIVLTQLNLVNPLFSATC